jgi:hypothetical protein
MCQMFRYAMLSASRIHPGMCLGSPMRLLGLDQQGRPHAAGRVCAPYTIFDLTSADNLISIGLVDCQCVLNLLRMSPYETRNVL